MRTFVWTSPFDDENDSLSLIIKANSVDEALRRAISYCLVEGRNMEEAMDIIQNESSIEEVREADIEPYNGVISEIWIQSLLDDGTLPPV